MPTRCLVAARLVQHSCLAQTDQQAQVFKGAETPLQLPAGAAIDLDFSGVGNDGVMNLSPSFITLSTPPPDSIEPPSALSANQSIPRGTFTWFDTKWFDANTTQQPGDVTILFNAAGAVDSISFAGDPYSPYYPTRPIFLLIGKRERIPANNNFRIIPGNPATWPNWYDLRSVWLVINPQNGAVTTVENAPTSPSPTDLTTPVNWRQYIVVSNPGAGGGSSPAVCRALRAMRRAWEGSEMRGFSLQWAVGGGQWAVGPACRAGLERRCRAPRTQRGAFSILEVLISMGILSLGLLGVAALIPVGKLALVETDKSDRGGACGRAALADVESLRMLYFPPAGGVNPPTLENCAIPPATGSNSTPVGYVVPISVSGTTVYVMIPFAIDPLAVTCNGTANSLTMNLGGTRLNRGKSFPLPRQTLSIVYYPPAIGAGQIGQPAQLGLTYQSGDSPAIISQKQAAADRIFRWRDDVTFVRQQEWTGSVPPNGKRPNGMYLHVNSNAQPTSSPIWSSTLGGADTEVLPANNGAYSWFATVVPSPVEGTAVQTFTVSVAVCSQRVLTQLQNPGQPDGEETIDLAGPVTGFLGGGYGGGTIQLPATSNLTASQITALANLKTDQWVMLCGWNTDTSSSSIVPVVCQWYRVVGSIGNIASSGTPTNTPNYLSLVGPDWNTNDQRIAGVSLVIVRNVIGVYTKTMRLDQDLTWSPH